MDKRKFLINIHDTTYANEGGGLYTANGYVINATGNTVATSGNDFTPEKAIYYNQVFMRTHENKQIHAQFGDHQTIPKHNGNVVNIRGISPYPTATTPLQEGVTPDPNVMNFYYVEIEVSQYGKFTPITDWAHFATRDNVITKDAENLASQSGRTLEEITAEVLNGGANVMYAPAVASDGTVTAVATRSAITPLSKFRVQECFRALNFLELQNAEPINGNHFVAIVHPNVKYDIMTSPDFIDYTKYAASERIFNGEIGVIGNIRFVVSNFAKVFKGEGGYTDSNKTTKTDVYSTLVIGKDAYTVLEIEGEGMQTIIKPLGSAGAADPINQRATQGWKTTYGVGITGQCYMVRIESASSSSMQSLDFNDSASFIQSMTGKDSSGNAVTNVVE